MALKRGLGKGLDSLIPTNVMMESEVKHATVSTASSPEEGKDGTLMVKLSKVEPNREQPRKNFDEDSLQELAESLKQFGMLQPILVQNRGDYYEIIAGERRWRAAKIAGLKEVPVIVRELTDQEIVEISLIENIQREDLNPIEEAQAYKRLLTEFHLKQDEVAERVSKSRTAVTNSMRLLKLCDEVQKMVVDDMISTGHARALISIEDPEEQYLIAQKIFDEKLSVTGLLLSRLNKVFGNVQEEEEKLASIFDILKEAKEPLMGAQKEQPLVYLEDVKNRFQSDSLAKKKAGLLSREDIHHDQQVLDTLEKYVMDLKKENVQDGESAFSLLRVWFNAEKEAYDNGFDKATRQLEYAFDFMESAFAGGQELVVFITELNTSSPAVAFLQEYSCERYYRYNKELLFRENTRDILERIRQLG